MIEVEKKFHVEADKLAELLKGAEFMSEKKFTDTYWDNADFSLTRNELWLRFRDNKFELKVPMHKGAERIADQFEEIEKDVEIAQKLGLASDIDLDQALINARYHPFGTFTTTRKKYAKDGFIIDVDELDFGYNIVEIELMVNDELEIGGAIDKILKFAESYGLDPGQVRGKITEYIKRNNPSHYRVLLDAGVVTER